MQFTKVEGDGPLAGAWKGVRKKGGTKVTLSLGLAYFILCGTVAANEVEWRQETPDALTEFAGETAINTVQIPWNALQRGRRSLKRTDIGDRVDATVDAAKGEDSGGADSSSSARTLIATTNRDKRVECSIDRSSEPPTGDAQAWLDADQPQLDDEMSAEADGNFARSTMKKAADLGVGIVAGSCHRA
jgi:hypothetical protein